MDGKEKLIFHVDVNSAFYPLRRYTGSARSDGGFTGYFLCSGGAQATRHGIILAKRAY